MSSRVTTSLLGLSALVVAGCSSVPARPQAEAPAPAISADPLFDLPDLVGLRLAQRVPVAPSRGATCEGPAQQVDVSRGDAPVLVFEGPGTWRVVDPPSSGAATGEAQLLANLSVGVHRVCVETEAGVAAVDLNVTEALYTQISVKELRSDGTGRWRSITAELVPSDAAPVQRRGWIMSDFQHATGVWDEMGRELRMAQEHDRPKFVYRFEVELADPVPPGGLVITEQRGTSDAHGVTEAGYDEFIYSFNHSPNSGKPTRRVEIFRLPPGAEVFKGPDFESRMRHGATELVKVLTIPTNGVGSTTFRYRLPGATVGLPGPRVVTTQPERGALDVDPALTELRITFDTDMADSSWSWVQVTEDTYPKTTGSPRFIDARTCVLPVSLQPDHDYVVWANYSPKYTSFRGEDGRTAKPFEFKFSTRAK